MNVILKKIFYQIIGRNSLQQFQYLTMATYIGSRDALELDNLLFTEYKYSVDQLMEIAGRIIEDCAVVVLFYCTIYRIVLHVVVSLYYIGVLLLYYI